MEKEQTLTPQTKASAVSDDLQSLPNFESTKKPIDSNKEDHTYSSVMKNERVANQPDHEAKSLPPHLVADQERSFYYAVSTLTELLNEELKKDGLSADMANSSNRPDYALKEKRGRPMKARPTQDQKVKRGRPMKERWIEEETPTDPEVRRRVKNRDAAHRYREKKKCELEELKWKETQQQRKNEILTMRVFDLTSEIHFWRRKCLEAFEFLPKFEFDEHSSVSVASASQSATSAAESIGIPSPSVDPADLLAQLDTPPETIYEEYFEVLLRQEAEDLEARNASLSAEIFRLYSEIIHLRKRMRLDTASTSADQVLSSLLVSPQIAPTQIAHPLRSTQS